jgi:hypothetical protein
MKIIIPIKETALGPPYVCHVDDVSSQQFLHRGARPTLTMPNLFITSGTSKTCVLFATCFPDLLPPTHRTAMTVPATDSRLPFMPFTAHPPDLLVGTLRHLPWSKIPVLGWMPLTCDMWGKGREAVIFAGFSARTMGAPPSVRPVGVGSPFSVGCHCPANAGFITARL